ncbi:MAG: ProQ/FinO family protein [Rubrivivax sp.]|nr:ProQ/FinO family protein [Rubrivivax sp.]
MTETPPAAAAPDTPAALPPPLPDAQAEPAAGAAPEAPMQEASPEPAPGVAAPALPDLGPAACAAELAARFPALFGSGRALPIKLRIQTDIQQRAPGVFSRKSLSLFLHRHTTTTAYLKALVASPSRFDLDGVAAGEVAEEHRQAATAEVERRRAIVEARRVAEREAARLAQRQVDAARREQAQAAQGEAPTGVAPAGGVPTGDAPAPRPPPDPRPPRPQRPQAQRPPHARPAAQRREPGSRPPRRPEDTNRPQPPQRPPPEAAAAPPEPFDEARRERAALLRTFESSTLTRANFCVLKRITEAELEAQLAQARQEREQRAPPPNRG